MQTRSKRKNDEEDSDSSKRKCIIEDRENSSFKTALTRVTESHSLNNGDVSSPKAGNGQAQTKDLSEWYVPEIVGGEVYYIPNFIDEKTANRWLSELTNLKTWYYPKLKVYGKDVSQSRSIAAYATDPNIIVKYSNHTVDMHTSYPPLLSQIQARVEEFLGETFNHVMLNLYKDGSEYIGKHRDTKENKMIVSLSIGAERTFVMTPSRTDLGAMPSRWKLASGCLVVMKGATQDNWKHEIPKEPKVKDERISLTFRQLVGIGMDKLSPSVQTNK